MNLLLLIIQMIYLSEFFLH